MPAGMAMWTLPSGWWVKVVPTSILHVTTESHRFTSPARKVKWLAGKDTGEGGTGVNLANNDGMTPLFIACHQQGHKGHHLEIVKWLAGKKARAKAALISTIMQLTNNYVTTKTTDSHRRSSSRA